MAKRESNGGGTGGNLVLGPKSTFFWGVVAGVLLCVAVCRFWCGHHCGKGGCMHGMSGCTYGEKAPAGKTDGKTDSK